jgi:hypothetical protein
MKLALKKALAVRFENLWFVLVCLTLASVLVGVKLKIDEFSGTVDAALERMAHPMPDHPPGTHGRAAHRAGTTTLRK